MSVSLSNEIIQHVFSFLTNSPQDLVSASMVSKILRENAEAPILWQLVAKNLNFDESTPKTKLFAHLKGVISRCSKEFDNVPKVNNMFKQQKLLLDMAIQNDRFYVVNGLLNTKANVTIEQVNAAIDKGRSEIVQKLLSDADVKISTVTLDKIVAKSEMRSLLPLALIKGAAPSVTTIDLAIQTGHNSTLELIVLAAYDAGIVPTYEQCIKASPMQAGSLMFMIHDHAKDQRNAKSLAAVIGIIKKRLDEKDRKLLGNLGLKKMSYRG